MSSQHSSGDADLLTGDMAWWRRTALIVFPAYLVLTHVVLELRGEHFIATVPMIVLALLGRGYARVSLVMLPVWLTGAVYDFSRLLDRFRGSVHVGDLHQAELTLFGVNTASGPMTLSEFAQQHTAAILDLICGIAYITYLFVPIALVVTYFFLDTRRAVRLSCAFLLMNVIGIIIYQLFPAAPPWYVAKYGTGPAILDVPADPAGAARFDALVGFPLFENWYARSANVFGAMPSLHVAYPTGAFLASIGRGPRWAVPTGLFALLVAFSAVYLDHHYLLDILAGITVAVVSDAVAKRVIRRVRPKARATAQGRVETASAMAD
jgi:membrane-associated phospholipid phosphatase